MRKTSSMSLEEDEPEQKRPVSQSFDLVDDDHLSLQEIKKSVARLSAVEETKEEESIPTSKDF